MLYLWLFFILWVNKWIPILSQQTFYKFNRLKLRCIVNEKKLIHWLKGSDEEKEIKMSKLEDKYENTYDKKYLKKYKEFNNDFLWTYSDKLKIEQYHQQIMDNFAKENERELCEVDKMLIKWNQLLDSVNLTENPSEKYKLLVNEENEYDDEYDEEEDEEEEEDYEFYLLDLKKNIDNCSIKRNEISNRSLALDLAFQQATEKVLQEKLDGFINNYILETTPLGNVIMRYNNSKQSFEYFSNSTIPYRYLEAIGRKYVTTFWCKPIFVDSEEEIKNAVQPELQVKPKIFQGPLGNKSFGTFGNKKNKTFVNNINSIENATNKRANRYTCEGLLSSFKLLKQVDNKLMNKNLKMSYAEFKKKNK
jgi:hypothetical protein